MLVGKIDLINQQVVYLRAIGNSFNGRACRKLLMLNPSNFVFAGMINIGYNSFRAAILQFDKSSGAIVSNMLIGTQNSTTLTIQDFI